MCVSQTHIHHVEYRPAPGHHSFPRSGFPVSRVGACFWWDLLTFLWFQWQLFHPAHMICFIRCGFINDDRCILMIAWIARDPYMPSSDGGIEKLYRFGLC